MLLLDRKLCLILARASSKERKIGVSRGSKDKQEPVNKLEFMRTVSLFHWPLHPPLTASKPPTLKTLVMKTAPTLGGAADGSMGAAGAADL